MQETLAGPGGTPGVFFAAPKVCVTPEILRFREWEAPNCGEVAGRGQNYQELRTSLSRQTLEGRHKAGRTGRSPRG